MHVIADPYVEPDSLESGVNLAKWPERLEEADFIIVNCALSSSSFHLLNSKAFAAMKRGVRLVNVGRGPVIDEQALITALSSGHVHSAALDVFEEEPLPSSSPLRDHPSCIFGSHNASNTVDGVERTSRKAIRSFDFTGFKEVSIKKQIRIEHLGQTGLRITLKISQHSLIHI